MTVAVVALLAISWFCPRLGWVLAGCIAFVALAALVAAVLVVVGDAPIRHGEAWIGSALALRGLALAAAITAVGFVAHRRPARPDPRIAQAIVRRL